MVLQHCCRLLMNKRPMLAACHGRFRRRKESAIRSLVAETLVLAKTHGYVEKIENELEEELARDICDPPAENLARWRRKGDKVFKSKYMLLIVVVLCIVDCAFVLAELALDLYKVKAVFDDTDKLTDSTSEFMGYMEDKYPQLRDHSPHSIFTQLTEASIHWPDATNETESTEYPTFVHPSGRHYTPEVNNSCNCNPDVNISLPVVDKVTYAERKYHLYIVDKLAHAFHYCSLGILAALLIETFLKSICAGSSFYHRKLEVFDAFIVLVSFLLDFSFIVFLPDIDTQDFIFILAILLPWRVIRVVNSLVVSVKDHEHFRLKLVYGRKKKIQSNLRDTENLMQRYKTQVTRLQSLCITEGIDEYKIDRSLGTDTTFPQSTPQKKKFKFKFDESNFMSGHNRTPRASMPSLNFHGLKLPSHLTKSRTSIPTQALNSIKHQISKTLPSRRASLATIEMFGTKMANGDLNHRKKCGSGDLTTMHEEMEDPESPVSSRATSDSEDVFRRMSAGSGSLDSAQTFPDTTRTFPDTSSYPVRHSSGGDEPNRENCDRLGNIGDDAKRRHSETTLSDRKKDSDYDVSDELRIKALSYSRAIRDIQQKSDQGGQNCNSETCVSEESLTKENMHVTDVNDNRVNEGISNEIKHIATDTDVLNASGIVDVNAPNNPQNCDNVGVATTVKPDLYDSPACLELDQTILGENSGQSPAQINDICVQFPAQINENATDIVGNGHTSDVEYCDNMDDTMSILFMDDVVIECETKNPI